MKFVYTTFRLSLAWTALTVSCGIEDNNDDFRLHQNHLVVGNQEVNLLNGDYPKGSSVDAHLMQSSTRSHLRGLGADKQEICHQAGDNYFHTVKVAAEAARQHLETHPNDLEGSCFGQCEVACRHEMCYYDFTLYIRESDGRATCVCDPEGPYRCSAQDLCIQDQCVAMPSASPSQVASSVPSSAPSFSPTCNCWTQIGADFYGERKDDTFGRSVAISADGSTVAMGAPGHTYMHGRVRIYRRLVKGASKWTQLGTDIEGSPATLFGFSTALSSDGNTIAIGTPWGLVRVLRYNDVMDSWKPLGGNFTGDHAGDHAGRSVSISADGNVVAIGAPHYESSTGKVRIYKFNGSSAWRQVGNGITGGAKYEDAGLSVSLSANGETIAIGFPGHKVAGDPEVGLVRVYWLNKTSADWHQLGDDLQGEAAEDESGESVSLSADGYTVAIGAKGNNGRGKCSGHVRVYNYTGAVWSQLGFDIEGDAKYDFFGKRVSLSADGQAVAIGAGGVDTASTRSVGLARVYKFDPVTTFWNQLGDDFIGEGEYDRLGDALALSADGNTLAVAAPYNDANKTSDVGLVRVFSWHP